MKWLRRLLRRPDASVTIDAEERKRLAALTAEARSLSEQIMANVGPRGGAHG